MDLPPSSSPVDQIFADFRAIRAALPVEALSEDVALDGNFRKVLVLGAASYLEEMMTFYLKEHVAKLGAANLEFVRKFALDHKFFQWFDFDKDMPGKFFKLFGSEAVMSYDALIAGNADFEASARSFMVICGTRNNLVHNNLASYSFDLTVEEIERHYRASIQFPPAALRVVGSCS